MKLERVGALMRPALRRAAGWMVGGKGLQVVVSFGANVALVRLFTPSDFGRFGIVVAVVGIVATVFNFRLEDVLLRSPDRKIEGPWRELFGTALAAEFGLITIGACTVLAFLGLLNLNAVLLVVGSATSSWTQAQAALYEREFDYRSLSVVRTLGPVVANLVAVVAGVLGLGVVVLYMRRLLKAIVEGLVIEYFGGLDWLPLRSFSWRRWKLIVRKVSGFWGDGAVEQIFDRLFILITGLLVGERLTGLVYQARLLARAPHMLISPVSFRVMMNYLSHQVEEEARLRISLRLIGVIAIPLVCIAATASWLAEPVIPWLFGGGWANTVPIFILMIGLIPGLVILDVFKAYFMAEGKMVPFLIYGRGAQYTGAVVGTVVALALSASRVNALAFGLSSAYLLSTIVLIAYVIRRLGQRQTRMDNVTLDTGGSRRD